MLKGYRKTDRRLINVPKPNQWIEDAALKIIGELSQTNRPMLRTKDLADKIGCNSAQAYWAVNSLGDQGLLAIARRGAGQCAQVRVTMKDGTCTGWSAPYVNPVSTGLGETIFPAADWYEFDRAMNGRCFENIRTKGEITRRGPASPPLNYTAGGVAA